MADEQHRWLDRETAERLLNGESPEAADPAARDQAERLARTLGALSAPPPSTGDGLPGEAAALAAFRAVRREREERAASDADIGRPAGAIRLGAPRGDRSGAVGGSRWTRPLRVGLAAALAAGVVGGAAALAGTGVLPASSDGSGADPTASATATATPSEGSPLSPPPGVGAPGGGPDRGAVGTAQDGPGARGDGGADGAGRPGPDVGGPEVRSGRGWQRIASACRDLRDGKGLGGDRRRLVEDAAGGPSRVDTYCEDVLSATGTGPTAGGRAEGETRRDGGVGGDSGGGAGGNGGGSGNGGGHGDTRGEDGGNGASGGNGGQAGKNGGQASGNGGQASGNGGQASENGGQASENGGRADRGGKNGGGHGG
ncbi:hypothetical protein GCM10019016_070650 [Streptomyces prasinosporus]|uniref:Extensin n=1 Tax=Streptomyces prasinosporus TaxID=68256 RepID=A0ABP6TX94_9ACTN